MQIILCPHFRHTFDQGDSKVKNWDYQCVQGCKKCVYGTEKLCAKCVICTMDTLGAHIYSDCILKCNSSVILLVLQGVVGRPRHRPRVDVVQLASRPWPPRLVAFSFWIRTWRQVGVAHMKAGIVPCSPAGASASRPRIAVTGTM